MAVDSSELLLESQLKHRECKLSASRDSDLFFVGFHAAPIAVPNWEGYFLGIAGKAVPYGILYICRFNSRLLHF